MTRAVFLDRDGVLNKAYVQNGKPLSPDTIEEMVIVPDAAGALGRLREHGFRLILVTNQPDVARGRITREQVEGMNAHVRENVPLDAIEVCLHDDADNCDCRKPRPGMLLRAAKRDGIALDESFMIGDRWRDIDCAHAAGCRAVFIDHGYAEPLRDKPDFVVSTFAEAVGAILIAATDSGAAFRESNAE